MDKSKKQLWVYPWSFRENIILTFGLIVIGLLLEYMSNGAGVPVIAFPYNLVFIILLILLSTLLSVTNKFILLFEWLTSVRTALISIVFFAMIVLLMGFIPQKELPDSLLSRLGVTHLFRSWPYFFSSLFLMLVLGTTVCKRMGKWNPRNIGFLLNHLGLWIVIAAGSLGNGDMQRVKMICYYDKPTWYGMDYSEKIQNLPFAIELKNFTIEDYNSEIILVNTSTGKPIKNKKSIPLIAEKGVDGNVSDYRIVVKTVISEALFMGDVFREVHQPGAVPAAEIQIFKNDDTIVKGWISASSFLQPPTLIPVNDSLSFTLAQPVPKRYKSEIKIYTSEEEIFTSDLEVNKPVSVMGWDIYQYSYDTDKGRYTEYSVIEAVRDPWLWVVYIGILFLILGSCFLFWLGKPVNV